MSTSVTFELSCYYSTTPGCIHDRSVPLNTESVKPLRRRYRSQRRQEQAAQTERDILSAAGVLFRDRGYGGTTMPLIAREAGVAVETIYRVFGSKGNLFKAVVEAAVAGGPTRADVPVEQRPAIRAVIEEPDPVRQLELYAATQPGIHRRSGPLLRALRDAATSDPELAALWHDVEGARLTGQGRLAGMLAERGSLRPGQDVDEARDIIWTLCSLAVYDHLVVSRGWSDERYANWLAETLAGALLRRSAARRTRVGSPQQSLGTSRDHGTRSTSSGEQRERSDGHRGNRSRE